MSVHRSVRTHTGFASSRQTAGLGLAMISLITGFALPASGQTTIQTTADRGLPPNGFFSFDKLESIDKVSGNVTYQIPLTRLPPGRAGSSVPLSLIYNSNIFDTTLSYQTQQGYTGTPPPPTIPVQTPIASQWGGWRYSYEYGLYGEQIVWPTTFNCTAPGTLANELYIYKLSAVTPDGSMHPLKLYGQNDNGGDSYYEYSWTGATSCSTVPALTGTQYTYYTTDGSYIRVSMNVTTGAWTMYLPDGSSATGGNIGPPSPNTPVTWPSSISDRNGNTFQITNGQTTYTDPTTGAQTPNVPFTMLADQLGQVNHDLLHVECPPDSTAGLWRQSTPVDRKLGQRVIHLVVYMRHGYVLYQRGRKYCYFHRYSIRWPRTTLVLVRLLSGIQSAIRQAGDGHPSERGSDNILVGHGPHRQYDLRRLRRRTPEASELDG